MTKGTERMDLAEEIVGFLRSRSTKVTPHDEANFNLNSLPRNLELVVPSFCWRGGLTFNVVQKDLPSEMIWWSLLGLSTRRCGSVAPSAAW